LTIEDCRQFHNRVFVPNNTIVAVAGDFDAKEMVAEVKKLVADWKKADLPKGERSTVGKPGKFATTILSMPQAAQLQMYMGHVGIRREDPDYYKLLVLDHVLGTGPGFTDRLSARLRDREGLAYRVSATITSTAGLEPGMFTCYIGTDNTNFDRVKKLFLEELNRIRDTKASAQEVEDAKTYLIGSRLLQFATTGGIAGQLAAIERFKLTFDYLDDFRKAVGAVTPADVQAVARKHIDPARMVLVAAGAIDKEGKSIEKKE
jgi:zinc protease